MLRGAASSAFAGARRAEAKLADDILCVLEVVNERFVRHLPALGAQLAMALFATPLPRVEDPLGL